MTTFLGWTPPPGVAVVAPPVHPETLVNVIYSDRSEQHGFRACDLNWSAEGDGPAIVAYAVVGEYKPAPEPREWWIVEWADRRGRCSFSNEADAIESASYQPPGGAEVFHVREVLPAAREVVAWAVVNDREGDTSYGDDEEWAIGLQKRYGGTVVKLTGVMPNG